MARIVDLATGEHELPPGEIGELVLSGPMVMQGYYNRPEETAVTLRNGWLYTGDIAKDETVKAFVVLKDGQSATPEEIIEFCRERMVRNKAPRLVEFRAELPKTLIGKQLRRVLVEEERKKLMARLAQPADAATEEASAITNPQITKTRSFPRLKLPFHLGKAG